MNFTGKNKIKNFNIIGVCISFIFNYNQLLIEHHITLKHLNDYKSIF